MTIWLTQHPEGYSIPVDETDITHLDYCGSHTSLVLHTHDPARFLRLENVVETPGQIIHAICRTKIRVYTA